MSLKYVSVNLGLMELKFEIQVFAFSNSLIFWEEILRGENKILQHNHLNIHKIYINLKILLDIRTKFTKPHNQPCKQEFWNSSS